MFFGITVCFYTMCYVLYINVGFTGAPSPTAVCSRRENSKSVYPAGGTKTQGKGEHSIGMGIFFSKAWALCFSGKGVY